MTAATLDIWTLYRYPADSEKEWVVRLFKTDKPTATFLEADSREECEAFVLKHHPGAIWLERNPDDDPIIQGMWL